MDGENEKGAVEGAEVESAEPVTAEVVAAQAPSATLDAMIVDIGDVAPVAPVIPDAQVRARLSALVEQYGKASVLVTLDEVAGG